MTNIEKLTPTLGPWQVQGNNAHVPDHSIILSRLANDAAVIPSDAVHIDIGYLYKDHPNYKGNRESLMNLSLMVNALKTINTATSLKQVKEILTTMDEQWRAD